MDMGRRRLLKGSVATSATLVAGGISGFPRVLRAAEPIKVKYARFARHLSGITPLLDEAMAMKRFDLKHGVDMSVGDSYASVPSYYANLAAGASEAGVGAWDTFYKMHEKGVPLKLVITVLSGVLINFVTGPDGPKSIGELKGKTMAAISGSGALAMFSALAQQRYGLDLKRDVTLQNAQSPAAAMTLLLAGNVDGSLSWEPSVSNTLLKDQSLKPIFNVGKEYKETSGHVLPYFSVALRSEVHARHPDLGRRIAAAMEETVAFVLADPHEVFATIAPRLKLDPAALDLAFRSGRLEFLAKSMAEPEGRAMIETAAKFFAAAHGFKGDFDESFFIG